MSDAMRDSASPNRFDSKKSQSFFSKVRGYTRRLTTAFSLAAVMAGGMAAPARAATGPGATAVVEINTKYSKRARWLTKEFNKNAQDVKIVVMDRDWFQANLAARQIDPNNDRARAELAAEYIKMQTGIDVPAYSLFRYGMQDDLEHGEGYAWPAGSGPTRGMNPGVCTVFGQFADVDSPTQTSYLTGIESGFYPQLQQAGFKQTIKTETFRKAVDYHEIGHCLYHGQINGSGPQTLQDAVMDRHRSEMYAEIMAVLLLAHYDGVKDAGTQMANLRLTAGALNGQAFMTSYADPRTMDYYMDGVYLIHGGALGAQKAIDDLGMRKIRRMSLDELRALAHQILDQNAMNKKDMEAVLLMFRDKYDLSAVDQLRQNDPSYEGSYQYALKLREDMNAALPQVFNLGFLDPAKTPLEQIRPDYLSYIGPKSNYSPEDDALIINGIKEALITSAGGDRATTEYLILAFAEYKDIYRKMLEKNKHGYNNAYEMRVLYLMPQALMQAVKQVENPDPAPQPAPEEKKEGFRSSAIRIDINSLNPALRPAT